MSKNKDLQPWLEYFDMLRIYEYKGLLEVQPDKGEAYITLPALHAMSPGDDPMEQLKTAIPESLRRIRTYAGRKSQQGKSFLKKPFALHVVKDEKPHDLLYTLLITSRRRWWWPFYETDKIDTIIY